MHLYVATSNAGKLRDFAYAAAEASAAEAREHATAPILIEPLPGLAGIPAPPEEAATFEANARAKALYYAARAPGLLVVADDSGLEVDALGGAPGVRSARFAEDAGFPHPPASTLDERNNAALLRALDCMPEACRGARYRCVLALATADPQPRVLLTAQGTLEGVILTAPRGGLGFGYDPLFLVPEVKLTMAELDPAARLAHSHRARALRRLLQQVSEPAS
jgi:XTP/dITP diphosphohydrolase